MSDQTNPFTAAVENPLKAGAIGPVTIQTVTYVFTAQTYAILVKNQPEIRTLKEIGSIQQTTLINIAADITEKAIPSSLQIMTNLDAFINIFSAANKAIQKIESLDPINHTERSTIVAMLGQIHHRADNFVSIIDQVAEAWNQKTKALGELHETLGHDIEVAVQKIENSEDGKIKQLNIEITASTNTIYKTITDSIKSGKRVSNIIVKYINSIIGVIRKAGDEVDDIAGLQVDDLSAEANKTLQSSYKKLLEAFHELEKIKPEIALLHALNMHTEHLIKSVVSARTSMIHLRDIWKQYAHATQEFTHSISASSMSITELDHIKKKISLAYGSEWALLKTQNEGLEKTFSGLATDIKVAL